MRVRSAVGVFGATALVAAGLAPAASAGEQHGDHHRHHHEVDVTVCKIVKDDHDHDHGHDHGRFAMRDHGDHGEHNGEKFTINVSTDEDSGTATLRNKECASFELDFKKPKLLVTEDVDTSKWDVTFAATGDVVKTKVKDTTTFKVKFDDEVRHPEVNVDVTNERVHHHHHHD